MYKFGKKSKNNLNQCHPDLQDILNEAIKIYDFSVICGHRSEKEQNEAYNKGNSKLKWPQSKHNSLPSCAVDIVPFPIDWSDLERFNRLVGIIQGIAQSKGIKIRLGADFNSSKDYPHIELVNE